MGGNNGYDVSRVAVALRTGLKETKLLITLSG
jgi:hypothetical protein